MDDDEEEPSGGRGAPPAGTIINEDGCVCPAPEKVKKKKKPEKCEIKLNTCPYDPRFPNTNVTPRCYHSFVDYQRCTRLLGEDYPGCLYFLKCYRALCPLHWVDKWFTQMDEGTFPRSIYPAGPVIRPGPTDPCGPSPFDGEDVPDFPPC